MMPRAGRAESIAKRGKSKDHRPDPLQLVIGVVMRRDGMPVCCEIWPGNTTDVKTLVPVVDALKQRFRIRKVVVVCDRGMVSRGNVEALERANYEYIVGMKMRGLVEVRDEVLGRAGRYHEVADNLRVKQVWVDHERRYIVCFNPDEAKKDRQDRAPVARAQGRRRDAAGLPLAQEGQHPWPHFRVLPGALPRGVPAQDADRAVARRELHRNAGDIELDGPAVAGGFRHRAAA